MQLSFINVDGHILFFNKILYTKFYLWNNNLSAEVYYFT